MPLTISRGAFSLIAFKSERSNPRYLAIYNLEAKY